MLPLPPQGTRRIPKSPGCTKQGRHAHTLAHTHWLCCDLPGPRQRAQSLLARRRSLSHAQSKASLRRARCNVRRSKAVSSASHGSAVGETRVPTAMGATSGSSSLVLPYFASSVPVIAPGLCTSHPGAEQTSLVMNDEKSCSHTDGLITLTLKTMSAHTGQWGTGSLSPLPPRQPQPGDRATREPCSLH